VRYWLLLLLLTIGLRLLYVNADLYSHDSYEYAQAVEKSVETGQLQKGVSNRFMYVLLAIPFYLLFKDSYIALNVLTILFAGFSVVMLYILLKSLTNHKIALLSSLLFACNPLYLSITTYPKAHSVALFFVLLSLYLLKYNGWLSGAVYCISLLVRSDNIIYLPIMYIVMYMYKKNYSTMYQPMAVVVIFLLANMKLNFFVNMTYYIVPINLLLETLSYGLSYIAYSLSLPIFIILLMIYLMVFKRRFVMLLTIWFILAALPFMFINVVTPRYFLHAIIPLTVVIGYGMSKIKYSMYLAVALCVVMVVSVSPMLWYRHNNMITTDFIQGLPTDKPLILEDYGVIAKYWGRNVVHPDEYNGEPAYTIDRVLKYYDVPGNKKALYNLTTEMYYRTELSMQIRNVTVYEVG